MIGSGSFRLVGLDPGLRHTGWGIIDVSGNRLSHVANGAIHSDSDLTLAERLVQLHDGLVAVIERWVLRAVSHVSPRAEALRR